MNHLDALLSLCRAPISEIEKIGVYTITSRTNGKIYVGSASRERSPGLERYWVNQLDSVNDGFNLCYPGSYIEKHGLNEPYIRLNKYQLAELREVITGCRAHRQVGKKERIRLRLEKESNNIYENYWNGYGSIKSFAEEFNVTRKAIKNIIYRDQNG